MNTLNTMQNTEELNIEEAIQINEPINQAKMTDMQDILTNLKFGFDDINTKFDSSDWGQIEVRQSEYEKDVLNCLMQASELSTELHPVIGETLYLSIREKFHVKPFKLVNSLDDSNSDDQKNTNENEKEKEKKSDKKTKTIKVKKLNAADTIRLNHTIETVGKSVNSLLESFNENVLNYKYGLNTNKIVEFRGITFAYMAWFILKSKHSSEYLNKKSKLPEVYEVMCSMQRFINTCINYSGKSISNSQKLEQVSPTLINDVNKWLKRMKRVYPFDGITIYNVAPKLLIHSQFDDAIPNRSIKMRPNQKQLMDVINLHPEGFLLFYNAAIASGKTTLASVGIAAHLERLRKNGVMKPNTQLIFCCNLASVRSQVARNCWNAGIKFGIGSYIKSTGSYKITNHWSTKDDDRVIIIASPDVTSLLLEEDEKRIREDNERPMKERKFYSGKYWLFLDEPTVGADILGSKYLESNTRVMCSMPKWSILSSATMPVPEKITNIINHHRTRFPEVYIETQVTKEISIGCDVKTFENDMVVPHIGCKTQEEIKFCIFRINEVPFLGRLYTFKVAEQLWNDMKNNGITDIPDIKDYFSNVDNLSSDKVRQICITMLTKLSEQPNNKIRKICSSQILPDVQATKKIVTDDDNDDGFAFEDDDDGLDKVIHHVEFSKFSTSEAAKYLNMNLIATLDPIYMAKHCFSEILRHVSKSGIDINRLRNYISSYQKKVDDYNRTREYLAKSLDVSKGGDRKEYHFEQEAQKRGCGTDDMPTLDFPKEFQINTLAHWKKYGSHYEINPSNLRSHISITSLPLSEFEADDWLVFLLFCGVGVYSPYQIKDHVYLREVLKLAESGNLAFLVSDSSICYGTNYPINRVFITKDFADTHSINTLFQLMGRAGRAGQSWKAEIYLDKTSAIKIIDFVQNPNDTSGELEAINLNKTFEKLMIDKHNKEEAVRIKQEEEEKRLIEEALYAKKREEEAARIKKLQKEKLELEKSLSIPTKVTTVQQIIKPEEKRTFSNDNNKKSYYSNSNSNNNNKFGEWRKPYDNTKQYDNTKPFYNKSESIPVMNNTSTSSSTNTTSAYVPPWKRAGEDKKPVSGENNFKSSGGFFNKKPVDNKVDNKKEGSNSLSWRK